jgi:hypothetical protein
VEIAVRAKKPSANLFMGILLFDDEGPDDPVSGKI